MSTASPLVLHLAGLLAILGSLLYALGDVLLLAPKVGPIRQHVPIDVDFHAMPEWRRRAALLHGLLLLPAGRMVWGGLLGVFAAPLVLAGIWHVYQGLLPAGAWLALPPTLLWVYATVIGPFIHGSFIYLAQQVQMVNAVDGDARPLLLNVLARQQRVLKIGYSVLFACSIVAAIWYAVAVASGRTLFPIWMAALNPVTATIGWLMLKRLLPRRIADYTEGAGFNIAYLLFFNSTTFTLW